ncbi:unnamed protein product, partial [Coregonus sp. 'balchen']
MAASSISKFIEAPSVDSLKALKAELLVLVREGLVRERILSFQDKEREVSGEDTGRPSDAKSEDRTEEGVARTPFTLPRFDPLSSASGRSSGTARLKVRLARLEMEQKDKERQMRFELVIRKMEIEKERE